MSENRILIVDDESIIRLDLREMLTAQGYVVIGETGDGQSAIALTRELRPDLVILDIKMSGIDGIEAARVISAERLAPVLLLTAFSQQDLVKRAGDAGVVGYLVKPFSEADLVPAIEIAIARYAELRASQKESEDLRASLESRKAVERAKGILMETAGLTEADAFRRIQRLSMNSRRSMREVAEAILLGHEARTD